MPWYRIPGGGVCHINMGRKGGPAPCRVCGWVSTRLCDWRLGDIFGRERHESLSCDAPLCAGCGWSPAPDKDLCPAHVAAYRRWLVEAHLIALC